MNQMRILSLSSLLFAIFMLNNCGKEKDKISSPQIVQQNDNLPELDFEIKNRTGKTIYATCFTYIQKEPFARWRWDKSPVYKLNQNESVFINIDTIQDKENREHTFGYMTVFENEQEANNAIYELVPDKKKIDLDQLIKLNGKKIFINIEKYGFKEFILDFAIVEKTEIEKFKKKQHVPELDFTVENRTGKTIFLSSFVYQVRDNFRTVWRYDKTPVQKLEPGQSSIVDVDTIIEPRNRKYMSGFLAIFEEHEEEKAIKATYELLQPKNKIGLGRLSRLYNKKVVIEVEQYGAIGEVTDIAIRPINHVLNLLVQPQETTYEPPKKRVVKKEEKNPNISQLEKVNNIKTVQTKKKYKLFEKP